MGRRQGVRRGTPPPRLLTPRLRRDRNFRRIRDLPADSMSSAAAGPRSVLGGVLPLTALSTAVLTSAIASRSGARCRPPVSLSEANFRGMALNESLTVDACRSPLKDRHRRRARDLDVDRNGLPDRDGADRDGAADRARDGERDRPSSATTLLVCKVSRNDVRAAGVRAQSLARRPRGTRYPHRRTSVPWADPDRDRRPQPRLPLPPAPTSREPSRNPVW